MVQTTVMALTGVGPSAHSKEHYEAEEKAEKYELMRWMRPSAAYVKPFAKRQKNDWADAKAIAKAAMRPTMCFIAMKSAATQGRAVAFRTHQCLVRQRTQLINALRSHLAEFGLVAPVGPASLKMLETTLVDETAKFPDMVRMTGAIYIKPIARLTEAGRTVGG